MIVTTVLWRVQSQTRDLSVSAFWQKHGFDHIFVWQTAFIVLMLGGFGLTLER